MATIYTKTNKELLTPGEAAVAVRAFAPPKNYQFRHWSSSPSQDNEVTALNPGGAGISVTSNLTYYPVVSWLPIISMSLTGQMLTYNINNFNIDDRFTEAPVNIEGGTCNYRGRTTDGYNSFRKVNIIACPTETTDGALNIKSDYYGNITVTGNRSGTMPYNVESAAVDFGIIVFSELPAGNGTKDWEIVSEIDNKTYILSGVFLELFGNVVFNYKIYKVINGIRVLMTNLNTMLRHVMEEE